MKKRGSKDFRKERASAGGKARAKKLSARTRKLIAQKASLARWKKRDSEDII